jgi:pilus assembly protein Flp/PilA
MMMQSLLSLLHLMNANNSGREGISCLAADARGVTAIEYGLIAALIAVAAVVVMGTVGTNLSTTFSEVASSL